jgi:hypothetical protein
VVQVRFVAGRKLTDMAATAPVSSAWPKALAHSPTATSDAAAAFCAV